MRALVFGDTEGVALDARPAAPSEGAPRLVRHLAVTPMALQEVPEPTVRGPEWAVLRTRLTGICGSDVKQVLMDFEGPADSPMTAFISFPQVLGHEIVATVEDAGPDAGVEPGQRVVVNPWLSCVVRGLDPVCPACAAGDFSLCWRFHDGALAPGIHAGNSTDAPGGFAERLPAHRHMLVPVPDGVADEVAVLADPFSVALHAVTRNPPPPGGRAVVYGAGALGTGAVAILRALHPDVEVAAVARWPAQRALATRLGAVPVDHEPQEAVIEALARWSGGVLRRPWEGPPVAWPGGVDVVYDTVGAPDTLEVGLRVLRARGHDRAAGPVVDGPLRVDALVPQGGPAGRVQRLRRGGGRRRAPARHGPLPRPGGRRPHRPDRTAHPPVPAGAVAGCVHDAHRPGHDGRHQVRLRPPPSPVTWARAAPEALGSVLRAPPEAEAIGSVRPSFPGGRGNRFRSPEARQWVPFARGRGNQFRIRNRGLKLRQAEPIASTSGAEALGSTPRAPRAGRGNGFRSPEGEAIGSASGTVASTSAGRNLLPRPERAPCGTRLAPGRRVSNVDVRPGGGRPV